MSGQRIAKVESLVGQLVATALLQEMSHDSAYFSVTRVDVSPDMRNAVVWLGILGDDATAEKMFKRVLGLRSSLQSAIARGVNTKYAPHLTLKHDTNAQYAADISHLINSL